MAASTGSGKDGPLSPRSARVQMEEALGKPDITEEEATPLVLDDRGEDGAKQKWSLAGKVLCRTVFHINTIDGALRPAWGNPKGLAFRSVGVNMSVADFETSGDHDRVKAGSPWHVSNNAVVLEEFVDHMWPSELKFDKLQLWARVINLPFNLMNETWGKAISRQLDTNASSVTVDSVGGFLRARIMVDVTKPLRRGMLIDSAKRKSTDWYEIQYEQIPHFCFSCGRLGHSDIFCPTPGSRDDKGNLPFGPELRADDRKKANSTEQASRERSFSQNSKHASNSSNTAAEPRTEVTSPDKRNTHGKRKGGQAQQINRRVTPVLAITDGGGADKDHVAPVAKGLEPDAEVFEQDHLNEEELKRKKPTPTNFGNVAAASEQPCPSQ
jgi:hypothetical protein